jgi:hypothetical protein
MAGSEAPLERNAASLVVLDPVTTISSDPTLANKSLTDVMPLGLSATFGEGRVSDFITRDDPSAFIMMVSRTVS